MRRQRTREGVPAMAWRVTDLSKKCLSYLALSGRNIATASHAEKDLC
jgi:hypothetical protein